MRILAIDPSLRCTGYGVIEADGPRMHVIEFGEIKNPASRSMTDCLRQIHEEIAARIRAASPAEAAVEGIIYAQNTRTAITMGAARGAALVALATAGIPVYEYAPKRVKAAATGRGGAQKAQVGFMVRALLGLTTTPSPDAADALAIAVTHAQSFQRRQGLAVRL